MRDIYPDDEDVPAVKTATVNPVEPHQLSEMERILREIIEEACDDELAAFDALCISRNGK